MVRHKKKKNANAPKEDEYVKKAPHTFIIKRGAVGRLAKTLVINMRKVMEPYTAVRLKAQRQNRIKDFINLASVFNVSHLISMSQTKSSLNLKFIKTPRGPTISFKVVSFSLMSEVVSSLKRHYTQGSQYIHHPLLILNGFSTKQDDHSQAAVLAMFQNMFPSINLQKMSLLQVRRCVLINFDPETSLIDWRHYNITVKPAGVSRPISKLLKPKRRLPDLSKYSDISDFVMAEGADLSESEGEELAEGDDSKNRVTVPESSGSKSASHNSTAAQSSQHGPNKQSSSSKSIVRLTELGPRITMRLYKIEEGVCSGEVLFNEFVEKTDQERKHNRQTINSKRKLKEARRREQEENVKRKEEQQQQLASSASAARKKKTKAAVTFKQPHKSPSPGNISSDMPVNKKRKINISGGKAGVSYSYSVDDKDSDGKEILTALPPSSLKKHKKKRTKE